MERLLFILASFFILVPSNAQTALTIQQVDSIGAEIDNSNLLQTYTKVDSSSFSKETGKMSVYSYKTQKDGHIAKIETIGNGTCDSKEQFYFLNGKLLKAVIKMTCSGSLTWDSEIYFQNDIAFAQTDRATPLYSPAFKQSAYNTLTRLPGIGSVKKQTD